MNGEREWALNGGLPGNARFLQQMMQNSPSIFFQTSPRKYFFHKRLISEISPHNIRVLALFGDQFAKQFTSESVTWVDHLIFAMVPLGIIAAITGAIRIQGTPMARPFIGRARENRAQAEIELM